MHSKTVYFQNSLINGNVKNINLTVTGFPYIFVANFSLLKKHKINLRFQVPDLHYLQYNLLEAFSKTLLILSPSDTTKETSLISN